MPGTPASIRTAYTPCFRGPLPPRRRSIRIPSQAAKSFAVATSNVCSRPCGRRSRLKASRALPGPQSLRARRVAWHPKGGGTASALPDREMSIESVKPGIWIAYGTVLAVLLLGSGTTRVLINRFPERDYTELRLRVRTWWMIVAPVAIVLLTGKALSILLLRRDQRPRAQGVSRAGRDPPRRSRGCGSSISRFPSSTGSRTVRRTSRSLPSIPVFALVTLPMIVRFTREPTGSSAPPPRRISAWC